MLEPSEYQRSVELGFGLAVGGVVQSGRWRRLSGVPWWGGDAALPIGGFFPQAGL
jgi:hypothetical protein